MKFTDKDTIFGAFRMFSRSVCQILATPFRAVAVKYQRGTSPSGILGKVSGDIRGEVRDLGRKPDSLAGYIRFG